jgi:hypothetical protein
MTLLTGNEYMELLVQRQREWFEAHQAENRPWTLKAPPLLEWFILPGDEDLVDMAALERTAEPEPKRETRPRTYRSAASLREERDRVQARMDAVAGRGDCGDVAAINIAPSSSNRRIAAAGRRRFAQMDRDLEQYTKLRQHRDHLNGRIANAEAREARAAS